jgi:polyhydroxyalkanoate synthase
VNSLGSTLRVASHGRNVVGGALRFSGEAVRVLAGRSQLSPERGDRRFADPTWDENPVYRRVKQTYLAGVQTVDAVVDKADVDWRTRERARFAAKVLTSALAPTNTLAGNPAALKRAIETGGGSLLTGLRHFASDVRHNRGMPSQVDASGFRVGESRELCGSLALPSIRAGSNATPLSPAA